MQPSDPRFDWALVQTFLAVLEAGSLNAAAKRLGAQQPTLSRQIAALETQLGSPLFERTGRGVAPTAIAIEIAEAARAMEAGAEDILRRLALRRDRATGTVRISTSQVAASYLLPSILATLQEEEPGIQVEIVVNNEIANLLRREADIAVRMVRPDQTSLLARKLADIPIVACAHQSYLDRFGAPRDGVELLRHRLVGFDRDNTVIQGFAAFGMSLKREHFALRTDDHVAYGRLIKAGAGIGFTAAYVLKQWPGVVAILPDLRIPPMPCWLAVHREIHASAIVRRVYDHLAKSIPPALSAA